jgi:hypothetical protein
LRPIGGLVLDFPSQIGILLSTKSTYLG